MTKRYRKIVKWHDDFDYESAFISILLWAITPVALSLLVKFNWMVAWVVIVSGVTIIIFIIQRFNDKEVEYEEIK